jgi:flagellar biosynthesis/type III secretory pathway M-ring protein FliF/YscJ
MKRFKETEYQFHSDISSSGYKKYYDEDDLDSLKIILFEAKMSKKIQANYNLFDKTERLTLL